MSSGINAGPVAAAGRAAAEGLMTDACRIERTGPVQTSQDGTDTLPVTVLYEGPCRVRPAGTRASAVTSDTAPTEVWQYKVTIPFADGAGVRSHDLCTITGSADPTLVGLSLQVRNIDRGTHISSRRVWCTEVSR